MLVLDLGDDVGLAAEAGQLGAHGLDVGFLPAETEGEIIDAEFDAQGDVLQVLFGHGREVDFHPGQVDVSPRAEDAAGQHLAMHAVFLLGQDLHVDVPVVDHDHIALADIIDQAVVVHVDRVVLLAFGAADGELHLVAGVEVELGGHVARTDGRPLGIHHDGDVGRSLARHLADARDNGPDPFVGAMAHVQPEDIGARRDEPGQHLGGFAGGAEGADDFGFAHGGAKPRRRG